MSSHFPLKELEVEVGTSRLRKVNQLSAHRVAKIVDTATVAGWQAAGGVRTVPL